jgi:hypothetical protein
VTQALLKRLHLHFLWSILPAQTSVPDGFPSLRPVPRTPLQFFYCRARHELVV